MQQKLSRSGSLDKIRRQCRNIYPPLPHFLRIDKTHLLIGPLKAGARALAARKSYRKLIRIKCGTECVPGLARREIKRARSRNKTFTLYLIMLSARGPRIFSVSVLESIYVSCHTQRARIAPPPLIYGGPKCGS